MQQAANSFNFQERWHHTHTTASMLIKITFILFILIDTKYISINLQVWNWIEGCGWPARGFGAMTRGTGLHTRPHTTSNRVHICCQAWGGFSLHMGKARAAG